MQMYLYLFLFFVAFALAAAFIGMKIKSRDRRKKIPEIYFGAIRTTDHQGRDMLIVRKHDGSFELMEEEEIRRS